MVWTENSMKNQKTSQCEYIWMFLAYQALPYGRFFVCVLNNQYQLWAAVMACNVHLKFRKHITHLKKCFTLCWFMYNIFTITSVLDKIGWIWLKTFTTFTANVWSYPRVLKLRPSDKKAWSTVSCSCGHCQVSHCWVGDVRRSIWALRPLALLLREKLGVQYRTVRWLFQNPHHFLPADLVTRQRGVLALLIPRGILLLATLT